MSYAANDATFMNDKEIDVLYHNKLWGNAENTLVTPHLKFLSPNKMFVE